MIALLLMLAVQGAPLDCANAMTQHAINACAKTGFDAADAALNAQWNVTLSEMRRMDAEYLGAADEAKGYAAALLDAQRAWLAYRDAHCLSESYQMRGGTGAPMLLWGCKATLTRERTTQLKALVEGN